jgi:hypothetical protein
LKRFATSGQAAQEFCRSEGLTLASFWRWHRKLVGDDSVRDRFVEVDSPTAPRPSWTVELKLPGEMVLRIRG